MLTLIVPILRSIMVDTKRRLVIQWEHGTGVISE